MNRFIQLVKTSYQKPHPLECPEWLRSLGFKVPPMRPLPRSFVNEELGISEVTKPFQSLPDLKRLLIDDEILSLYSQPYTVPKISLLTYVYWDGLGDYYGQKHLANFLKLAGVEVSEVSLVRKGKTFAADTGMVIPFEPSIMPTFSPSALETIQKSHIVLQFPTYFPFTMALQKLIRSGPYWEYLGEYGFINTVDYQPGTKRRSLGLHALEKGVFIPTLRDLDLPDEIEVPYFLAYTKTSSGFFNYLKALLESKKRWIHIITFNPLHVIQAVQKKPKGLSKVTIKTKETLTKHQLEKKGAEVFIDVMSEVPHEKFLSLLKGAHPFVACTGDTSFSEALALCKLPFYDPPPHKTPFFMDLTFIAETLFPKALPFFKSPHHIHDLEVKNDLYRLYSYIREERAANQKILQMIYRRTYPKEILRFEEKLVDDFSLGTIKSQELLEKLKNALNANIHGRSNLP
ncbi:MAG: hypothetical protein HRU43_05995 [Simkaniaceae bacterium]|nr:hypothetical protein [Simkaniaceae bacterium]